MAQRRIEPVDVSLNVGATAFVDDFTAHDAPGIGERVAGRRQRATDAVNAFAEHDFDSLDAFVQDYELESLARVGDAHGDFFIVHEGFQIVYGWLLRTWPKQRNCDCEPDADDADPVV